VTLRLGISVEGQTEERFVKDLLAPHLAMHNIAAIPIIVATSRSASGKKSKGGGINLDRIAGELRRLLGGFRGGLVTSFYDFYGFEDKQPSETVDALEARIAKRLGKPPNLIPYVQLHEYEALLLSDAATIAAYFQAPALEESVRKVVTKAGNPELVNDDPATAPSKRLDAWTEAHAPKMRYSNDTKTRHGPMLATRLTLPVIRAACPRFGAWLGRLEALGAPQQTPPLPSAPPPA
jgi:Domain of unknown function (DUF4276)